MPNPTIRKGSWGEAVRRAQRALIERSYLRVGDDDGEFDLKTDIAVRKYQEDRASGQPYAFTYPLVVDGIVGPLTWGRLDPDPIQKGSKGVQVSLLQRMLKTYGLPFDPGPVDGDFGPVTETAVKTFQSAHSLPVDGIVGPEAWSTLDRGLRAKPSEFAKAADYSTALSEVRVIDDVPFLVFRVGMYLLLFGLGCWLVALAMSRPRFALAAALLLAFGALSVMFGVLSGRRNVTISVH